MTLEDNQLMVELIGWDTWPFFAESETDFFTKRANVLLEFVRGDDGIVTHLITRQGSFETTVPRK